MHRLSVLGRYAASIVLLLALFTLPVPHTSAAGSPWDTALERVKNVYGDYAAMQEQVKLDHSRIQHLRKANQDLWKEIKKKLGRMDQVRLDRLKQGAEAARKQHAPLLEKFKTLGEQRTAARQAKDLKSAAILELQYNKLRPSVAKARAEIKSAAEAYTAARKETVSRIQPVKDLLSSAAAIRKESSTVSKELGAAEKLRTAAYKRYQAAVKQGDANGAAEGLETAFTQLKNVSNLQQKLMNLEKQIAALLRSAESKLPK